MALAASQRALDVTGQNISNVNTQGYTRQRLDLASISPTGASKYMMQNDCRVGQGVYMSELIQIRDPALDVKYRNHLAKVGVVDAQDATLSEIGEIFDEIDTNAVSAALNNVVSQLNNMADPSTANQGSSDALVRSAMEVLINIVHENANSLQEVRDGLVTKLETTEMDKINGYLKSIQDLNVSIRNTQILGGGALELQDERNELVDELATYFPISVTYEDMHIGSGIKVQTMKIEVSDAAGKKYLLVDDKDIGEVSFDYDEAQGKASISIRPLKEVAGAKVGGRPVYELDDPVKFDEKNELGDGVLRGDIDELNKSGVFDGTDVRGIGYYEKYFDAFINTFATTLNDMNKNAGGGALFTTTDGKTEGFTAANIKVSDAWLNNDIQIMTSVPKKDDEDTTAYDNVLAMIDLFQGKELEFKYGEGNNAITAFKGNLLDAYDNLRATQAIDKNASSTVLSNRIDVMNEISDSKDSVSGVYMDEEVMNLMRYSQSYNAAARVMTTMDEVLDKLINSTGVVGR